MLYIIGFGLYTRKYVYIQLSLQFINLVFFQLQLVNDTKIKCFFTTFKLGTLNTRYEQTSYKLHRLTDHTNTLSGLHMPINSSNNQFCLPSTPLYEQTEPTTSVLFLTVIRGYDPRIIKKKKCWRKTVQGLTQSAQDSAAVPELSSG